MIRQKLSLYWRKATVALRDLGIKHMLRRVMEEALLRHLFLTRQYILYEKQLTELDSVQLRNPQLNFSFISADSHKILHQIEELSGLSQEMVSEMLIDGGECLVAMDDDNLAGFNLISYGDIYIHYLERNLMLSESEVWSEQIFVSLPYRETGVATDLRQIMFHHLADKGYTKLIGGYLPYNVSAGMLAKSLGFIEKEKVTLVKIFGWKKYFVRKLHHDTL